jgi:hypothetical protein
MKKYRKTTILPVLSGGKDSVVFKINPLFRHQTEDAIAHVDTDLLVLTALEATMGTRLMQSIDSVYDGVLQKKIAEANFTAQLGQHILVDMAAEGFPEAPMKRILLVGLGHYSSYGPRTACGFFQSALETAINLGVTRVTFTVMSSRLTDESLTIAGTMALLRCRLGQYTKPEGIGLGNLAEVELICSSQASRFVRQGLNSCGQRCRVCRDLSICQSDAGDSE